MVSLIRLVLVANSIKVSANLLKLSPPQSTSPRGQIFGAGESFILETENGRKGEEGKRGEEKGREEGEEKKRKGRRSEPCDPGTSGFSLE